MRKLVKLLLKWMPFKKSVFTVLKFFWLPSKKITQHLYFKAIVKIKVDSEKSFLMKHYGYMIENELFWHGLDGGWEKTSFKLWKELSKNADIIFDIGANTGVYSLISGAVNPTAKIFAFEPIKPVFKKLDNNIGLNRFEERVKAYEIALSDFTGDAVIYLEKNAEHALSVTVNKSLLPVGIDQRTEDIKTIRLDEFIENADLQQIDLMKIDVETHEPEVLTGMGVYIKKFKPTILIEILNDDIGQQVEALVDGLDYLYFNIDEETNKIEKVDHITQSKYYNYLLCDAKQAEKLQLI